MKLMVIDGNSLINRAFYGIRSLNAPDGTPTNAVFGFIRILQKLLADEKPAALAVAFDRPEPTFRHEMSDAYKATRHGMPDELAVQMPIMKDVLDAMNIVRLECAGWEADDILGSLAAQTKAETVIVTGDKDSLQLVDGSTRVLLIKTVKGQTETTNFTEERFREEYGFEPPLLIDLKALMGDTSDNIPGVKGVGEKTATDLVQRFGGIDALYADLDAIDIKDSLKSKLRDGKAEAELSKTLATIRTDAPVEFSLDAAKITKPDAGKLYEIFARLGFNKLIDSMKLKPDENAQMEFDGIEVEVASDVDASRIGSNIKERYRNGDATDYSFDVSLAAWVLSPTDRHYDLETLARRFLGRDLQNGDEAKLYMVINEKLSEIGASDLFYKIEMPLCKVLADMEIAGILVDRNALFAFGEVLTERIALIQARIFELADGEFNIASPKQLGEVLFDKLMLPAPKKTKTGYSTAAEVLDKLEDKHEIISEIKMFRELTKLKATYTDGLLAVIADDGRIHTTFQMTATATGRLSSTEPNLQNIPVRRELGAGLRRMFVAGDGNLLVDADYSQIELRILAHIAGDSAMIDAFTNGEDIHAVTAARVFGVPLAEVTPLLRSRAKAVNFGIVYGISAFSLSKDIGVSVAEAKEYMESYFARFSGVHAYMTDIVLQAKKDGYVTTLFGRRRAIPELNSRDHNLRAFGERVALNTPIQGTAADIMKLATVEAARALAKNAPESKLILQVHDELIVEAPQADAPCIAELLKNAMEGAAKLSVPLTAEAKYGKSWGDCK
ncbi:MAG: DNA polymerase I [Oscillospiraceae bacterium]|jgi:DNA polymerase-1|nr:DNA polymerase I [Oscillospiraceae bacterium]